MHELGIIITHGDCAMWSTWTTVCVPFFTDMSGEIHVQDTTHAVYHYPFEGINQAVQYQVLILSISVDTM